MKSSLVIPVIFSVIVMAGLIPWSFSANANLFVSAENSQNDNLMSGSEVVEVKIIDSDINDTDEAKGEPDVSVNGATLRMVQAVDGNWYGYFADVAQAQIADSTTNVDGEGLDFGTFCGQDSTILDGQNIVSVFQTVGIAINSQDGIDGTDPSTTPIPDCAGSITVDGSINVLTDVQQINTNSPSGEGQIGMDGDAWPFIQLYPLSDGGSVVVQYNKGGGAQTTTLTFQSLSADVDGDGINNDLDNCPNNFNPAQENLDGDNLGDVCDFSNIINTPTIVSSDFKSLGSLTVQNNSLLAIQPGISVAVPFGESITIKFGSGILIKNGASLKINNNFSPVLDNTEPFTLTSISKNETDPAGNLIQNIVGDAITDIDIGADEGIAVTFVDDTSGTWEYSTDDGSEFVVFGAVSDAAAVLLEETSLVRFVPDNEFFGVSSFNFRAWDQTTGINGDTGVDTTVNGGTTAYSATTGIASITVNRLD